ncbi:hypothetical protein QMA10_01920 [Arthrobacter sp. APC 3897]|nr:hypothetical protein [Arthrobacter sp. APC 3897]MDN3480683.1 hypothetical protein [Arthrobacter sp. APC 3897]
MDAAGNRSLPLRTVLDMVSGLGTPASAMDPPANGAGVGKGTVFRCYGCG